VWQHLRSLVQEYVRYYHTARPHESLGSLPPEMGKPRDDVGVHGPDDVECHEWLGGLLKHYERRAARPETSWLSRIAPRPLLRIPGNLLDGAQNVAWEVISPLGMDDFPFASSAPMRAGWSTVCAVKRKSLVYREIWRATMILVPEFSVAGTHIAAPSARSRENH